MFTKKSLNLSEFAYTDDLQPLRKTQCVFVITVSLWFLFSLACSLTKSYKEVRWLSVCFAIQAVFRVARISLELPLSPFPDPFTLAFIKIKFLAQVKGRFLLLSLAQELSIVALIWTSALLSTGVTCEFVMLPGKCFRINESDEILMKYLFFSVSLIHNKL